MASVASVYSKALFGVAKKENAVQQCADDLKVFSEACDASADLRRAAFSTLLDPDHRESVVASLAKEMKLNELTQRFVALLTRRNRLSALKEIRQAYSVLMQKETGVVSGTIRTAVKLSPEELKPLSEAVSRKVGKTVQLEQEEDEDLLGGFIIQAGGRTFDASLMTQLQQMQEICSI